MESVVITAKCKSIDKKTWVLIGTFVFISVVNIILILRHENWQDEAQAWMIARDVRWDELIETLSFEGHPILWFLVLMPFARLGLPYFMLHIISFMIMEIALALLLWRSPFSTLFKILLACSPLFVYYLATISRSHCLVALIIVIIACIYKKRDDHPLLYGLLLALLLQTHIAAAGLVLILCFFMLKDTVKTFKENTFDENKMYARLFGLFLPVLSGILLLVEFSHIMYAGSVGDYTSIGSHIAAAVILIASVTVIIIFSVKLRDTDVRRAALIAVISVVWQLILYLSTFNFFLQQRNILMLFMPLFSLWIVLDAKPELNRSRLYTVLTSLVVAIAVGLSGGYYFIIDDIIHPYSFAKETAEYINGNMDSDDIFFINSDTTCVSVLPYLDEDINVYNPLRLQLTDPYAFRRASFAYRGNNKWGMGFEKFKSGAKLMFPETDSVYLIYCTNTDVHGLEDETNHYEIEFDTFDKYSIVESERFQIVKIDISDI